MHGNEPVILAFIAWIALAAYLAIRFRLVLTKPGPAHNLRRAYVVVALPWLVIMPPAFVGVASVTAIGRYPAPTPHKLIERFGDSPFDILLGIYIVAIPALLFVCLAAIRYAPRVQSNGS